MAAHRFAQMIFMQIAPRAPQANQMRQYARKSRLQTLPYTMDGRIPITRPETEFPMDLTAIKWHGAGQAGCWRAVSRADFGESSAGFENSKASFAIGPHFKLKMSRI